MIGSIYVHFFDLGVVRITKITALCNYKLTYFYLSNNRIVLNNPKKTVPWNGHSLVIFTSQKPEGISKDGNNSICTS